nr:anthranilate synthase component I family protein [Microlunatus antarcticus]
METVSVETSDPLAAYVALRDLVGEEQVFLLESLAGPIADTRASLAGVTGLLEVQVHRSRVTFTGVPDLVTAAADALVHGGVTQPDGAGFRLTSDAGLFDLPRVLDAMFDVERDAERFGFGVLVFHGYDAVRYIERLPRLIDDPPEPAPDAVFALVRALVEIDLTEQTGRLTLASSPGWPELELPAVVAALEVLPTALPEPAVPAPLGVVDDTTQAEFVEHAQQALEHIRVGDIYQVQVGHAITVRTQADELTVYRRMRERNPSPYMSLMPIAGRTVVGASPELFLRLEGRTATMRPIAGTARRSGDAARDELAVERLLSDPKERAEHVMLVDLCRNDMGRVSVAGSVSVDDFMVIEAYSHLFHIVSSVSSTVRAEHDVYDVIRAGFPAGTMTGAPKVRAMEIIEELETSRRGLYAGSFGLIGFGGWTILGLAIRMTVRTGTGDDRAYVLRASAGVVADSTPDGEWAETLTKMGAAYWAVTGEELVS